MVGWPRTKLEQEYPQFDIRAYLLGQDIRPGHPSTTMFSDLKRFKILLDAPQRRRMAILLAGLIIATLLEMLGLGSIPAFVGLLSDPQRVFALLPEGVYTTRLRAIHPESTALYGAGFLAALFLVKNIYLAGLSYLELRLMRDVNIAVSSRLFFAYLCSPYTFHLQRNPAQLIRNTANEVGQSIGFIANSVRLLREGLVLLVVFGLLLLMDPLVSVAVFLLLGLAATTFYLVVRKSISHRGELVQDHRARQVKAVTESLETIKEAKLRGHEPHLLAAFEREVRGFQHHQLYQGMVGQLPRLFLETLAVSAVLLVCVVFLVLERPLDEMLPVLALLAVAVVRMVPAFNSITGALTNIRFQRPSLELVCDELEQLDPQAQQTSNLSASLDPNRVFQKYLRVDGVSFRYSSAAEDTLHDVSLTIQAGQAVALIGPSGAGKSTVVDIILGLLTPSRGRVLIDEWDMRSDPAAWQRQIGYVPQDIYLIDDSIRRNIALGLADENINASAVECAVRAAQLEEFIASLPEGLDTVVGNRGIRLSGGQRQRIGIARALYHNPCVLVMDEATSALDNETEREVVSAINRLRGDRTIVTVAHRLTTVEACDRLYLFEAGRVVDTGTYGELSFRHPKLQLARTDATALGKT